jgi:hypothetical protein
MDLRLAMLEAVSLHLLHNVSTLNQCRKLSCGKVVCKHFASYQGYPNYRLISFGTLRVNLKNFVPNAAVARLPKSKYSRTGIKVT